ncbi:MAG: hypothetical protein IKO73_08520 [Bacteroidaceae bacterium]|nr:hypothetical protein [Bacteroidaceae bacterium]
MTNDNFELEEMRQQMAILKEKLHQQEILNDRMTSKAKEALEKKVEQLTRGYKSNWVMALLSVPIFYFFFVHHLGFSIPFGIFSCLYMPLRLLYFHRDRNKLLQKNLFDGNLVEVQKNLILAKNHFTQGFRYDLILNIVFPIWLVWEIYQKWCIFGPQPSHFGMIVIGLPLGIALFLWGYYRRKRQYQEALDQIADLTPGSEMSDN